MNIFFLLSSKHEIFEAKFILANINHSNYKVFLLIEDSKRNQNLRGDGPPGFGDQRRGQGGGRHAP